MTQKEADAIAAAIMAGINGLVKTMTDTTSIGDLKHRWDRDEEQVTWAVERELNKVVPVQPMTLNNPATVLNDPGSVLGPVKGKP